MSEFNITTTDSNTSLFINRKQYEDDLKQRQKEHLDNVYNNNQNWWPCLHDSCPECDIEFKIDGIKYYRTIDSL